MSQNLVDSGGTGLMVPDNSLLSTFETYVPRDHSGLIIKNGSCNPKTWTKMARLTSQLRLVAIPSQCIVDRSLKLRLQDSCTTQLADFLSWLADRQMAGSRLAMLRFACCSQSKTLLSRLMSLWLVRWHSFYSGKGRNFKAPKFSDSCPSFQG